MLILALDCSTSRGSAALAVGTDLENFRWQWRAEFPAGRGHGGELFTTLERGLAEMRRDGQQLGEIVVGLGPGSYSGVRQAIAAATGLALATGARLHGRPSAAGLPAGLKTRSNGAFQVIGDARRGAFYYTAVLHGLHVAGPELVADVAALQARVDERHDWPMVAVESLPAGLPLDTPVAFP